MGSFLVIAVVLALLAGALVAVPLLRRMPDVPAARGPAVVLVILLLGGSALLYANWSSWSWKTDAAGTPAGMVSQLARRLDHNPDDLQGWLLLGRSYSQLEQYPSAVRAYQRADRLADGKNAEALTGLAEALVLGNQSDLGGRAGRLFEQALALEPRSTKALFYSAIAAMERGEKPLARDRFTTLLAASPPPEVRGLIESTLQNLDAPAAPEPAPPAPKSAAAASGAAPAGAVAVKLHITLSPEVQARARASAGAPLFVLARRPGERGPPLAAKRLEARFPQDVVLLSSDAMLAGSGFAAGDELEITARIANGGSAMARSGDPFGTVRVKAGAASVAPVAIGQLTP